MKRCTLLLSLTLLSAFPASAHVVYNEYALMTGNEAAWHFLWQGFQHILPQGFDHILFVLSLYLLSPKLKTILFQATPSPLRTPSPCHSLHWTWCACLRASWNH